MAKNEIKQLSFEQSLGELEDIVRKLESGSVELESAIDLYTKGISLKEHCQNILEKAKLRVEKIIAKDNEVQGVETFEPN